MASRNRPTVTIEHVQQVSEGGDHGVDAFGDPKGRWWVIDDEERASQQMVATVDALRAVQAAQSELDLRHLRLYGNTQYVGIGVGQYNRVTALEALRDDRLRMNIIRSCIDTVTAKVAKNRPRPMFITTGGTFLEQRKTKKLNRFMDGLYQELGIRKSAPQIFRDTCIFGTGLAKVFSEHGRPKVERVVPSELLVDEGDALSMNPRTLYQLRFVDKEVLAELYPKRGVAISASQQRDDDIGFGRDPLAVQIRVIEAWHLPSGPDADDGRHIIACRGGLLLSEPWKRQRFPFAVMRWSWPVLGWWGTGMVQEIANIQIEINYCLQKLQRILTLHAQPMVFVRRGAKVSLARLGTNSLGTIHEVNDVARDVQIYTPPALGSDLVQHIEMLAARAYQIVGVSQLSAQALKPAGLTAGVALETYDDIETERFAMQARGYEDWHVDLAELLMDEFSQGESGDMEVKYVADGPYRRGVLQAVKWADVAVERESYILQVFPTSSLPSRPEGKLQRVKELTEAGYIQPKDAMKLLDFPDLTAYQERNASPQDAIDSQIEHMMETGEQMAPEPSMDIAYAFLRAQQELDMGSMNEMPEETKELLRAYSNTARVLADRAKAAMQAQQAAAMPAPAAAPMPMGPRAMPMAAE